MNNMAKTIFSFSIFFFTFTSTFTCPCFSAFEEKSGSARAASLGNSFTGLADSPEAVFFNPAGLAQVKQREINTFYTQLFSRPELTYSSLIFSQPITKRGNLSFAYNQFGYSLYREKEFILSGSLNLSKYFFLGANLKESRLIQGKDWGTAQTWRIDLGALLEAIPKLRWGIMINNLNQPQLGGIETIPLNWRTGISYLWFPSITSLADYSQSANGKSSLHWGQEVVFSPLFVLRCGIETNPTRMSLGCGFNLNYLNLNYAFVEH